MDDPQAPSTPAAASPATGPASSAGPGYWNAWLDRPVLLAGLGALLFMLALEIWRPYFCLTDDNLNHSPVLVEEGRNIWAGRNPFVSQYLYEGNFVVTKELPVLYQANPVALLVSVLLVHTPFLYAIMDVVTTIYFIIAAMCTALLYVRLKQKYNLAVTNGLIVYITLSANFSIYSLVIASSCSVYVNNQSGLALILIGVIHDNVRRGFLWTAAGFAWMFMAGYPGTLIFTLVLMPFFLIPYCYYERRFTPLLSFFAGGILSLLIVSPYMYWVGLGFAETKRVAALSTEEVIALSFPFPSSLVAFLIGLGDCLLFQLHYQWAGLAPEYSMALPSSFAGVLLFCCWRPVKQIPAAAWCCLPVLALTFLLTDRPLWFQENVIRYIPLLNAMRWPLKELIFLIVFGHLFIVLTLPVVAPKKLLTLIVIGVAFWCLPLVTSGPPSISFRENDLKALTTGQADRYWAELKKKLPKDVIVVPACMDIGNDFWSLPQSSIANYFFGAQFGVVTPYYYSPLRQTYQRPEGGTFSGFGHHAPLPPRVEDFPDWMKKDERIRVLRAISLKPFHVELLNPSQGTTEDVTPLWNEAARP
ncbi:hypothetical protein DB346_24935 [Verrucomicrobia bacterium LW23]|nr:hypothetical protein DB346_24935 [Verrucomicrobia bacterium LW23]